MPVAAASQGDRPFRHPTLRVSRLIGSRNGPIDAWATIRRARFGRSLVLPLQHCGEVRTVARGDGRCFACQELIAIEVHGAFPQYPDQPADIAPADTPSATQGSTG